MYLGIAQIQDSLPRLAELHPFFGMSFLAFKKVRLPVGKTIDVVFTQVVDDILNDHYRPCSDYDGYYNPFKTSRKEKRWVAPRYGSTSLQRITTDTFSDALIHSKNEPNWGWRPTYIAKLKTHLNRDPIPAFDLAVWLFRNKEWSSSVTPESLVEYLFSEFHINDDEARQLFNVTIPNVGQQWIAERPILESDLLRIIGFPPGSMPEDGATLRLLETSYIGPATHFRYEPSDRLNIITGDNSLGKTFLLECIWWALTGKWLTMVLPRKDVKKTAPKIVVSLCSLGGKSHKFTTNYNWNLQRWDRPSKREIVSGLVIYARFDGSFAVWDPARSYLSNQEFEASNLRPVVLGRANIWNGLSWKGSAKNERWVCNGLLRDWVNWQTGGQRYERLFESLVACLRTLSPSDLEPLVPGDPIRVPFDSREIPTLKMPYGDLPVLNASAGVQRIIALAYILVWAWNEHLANSGLIRRQPQRKLVLIMDEVEAHLHPRWQRVIVPSLMEVVSQLSSMVVPQLHIATHSPMVMASAETVFNPQTDILHHLKLVESKVVLEELPFVKRGRADLWLISDVFGLEQARSLEAEKAIADAKALQSSSSPSDDDFWPRWRFFATQNEDRR